MAEQPGFRPHLDPAEQAITPPPEPEAAIRAAAARFDAALEAAPETGGRAADAEVLRLLRDAPIQGMGRVVYSSNAVFLIEFDAPDPHESAQPMRAIYKPRRGERPLWDFARHSLHLREVAAYRFDAALGFELVPATTLRDGPHGPGSVQLFIGDADSDLDDATADRRLNAVATLDVLINNADRKRAHLLLGPGAHLWAIDNALTFLPYPRQRTVLLELGGQPLPDDCAAAVAALAEDAAADALVAALVGLLDPVEIEAARARLRELAGAPVYPVLDPWDGRPWEGW